MVFSIITGIPMCCIYFASQLGAAYPELHDGIQLETIRVLPYETIMIFFFPLPPHLGGVIEDSHTAIFYLFGMIQSAFLCNVCNLLYYNYEWMSPHCGRIMSTMFMCYGIRRVFNFRSVLIPKLPIQVPWKSILFFTLFFSISGFYVSQYSTFHMMLRHFYVYFLCIEISIWYYTKEFRMFSRFPVDWLCGHSVARNTTVYRNWNIQK
ncbi:hypothetical protein GCK72_011028 [Caenorhabditis remanei]|uniref:Uncharacterized protein n=1 Tax=Caenorhabditis remanei TaxID=31234 RepID=A0A6A5H6P5_CAERE|nr:hypothetical protein GCK72_011028 [Caenorhabditis remanei]KAF1762765.1 hypothetical protein GCK72_011028 [Caenorhabditis remanei]